MDKRCDWYLRAKYGIYMTMSYEGYDRNPLPRRYLDTCGVFSDGRMPTDINEIADAFDVQGFADFCHEVGLQYVNFTLYHAHMYMLCPNAALDRWLPGHTSRRDVLRELIDALHAYGIRFQVYIHASVGDTMTDAEREATGYNEPEGRFKRWNDFINDVFSDLCDRYGSDIDSYYFDMIFDQPFMDMVDIPRLRSLFRTKCPDSVITGNGEANDLVDFSSREDCSIYIESEYDRYSTAVQHVVLLPAHESKGWWSSVPTDHPSVVKYSPEHLYRTIVLNAGSNTCGGGVAFGFGPYCDSGFEPGIRETMKGLWELIKPVSESILDTVPSGSWVTPSAVKISELPYGFTAVTSGSGEYEYIHILTKPDSDSIVLPKPLDGRRFSTPCLLADGRELELITSEDGYRIVNRLGWDDLDTVIRLKVVGAADNIPSTTAVILPKSSMKFESPDSVEGCPASNLGLDDPEKYWKTDSGNIHEITISLDGTYNVQGLHILPVQSNAREDLEKHIAICSIYLSSDSGETWRAVYTGELKRSTVEKICRFSPMKANAVKLVCGPDWFLTYEHKTDTAAEISVELAEACND